MARILICHVPKDGSIARELGAALMGRGHFVSFDGEPDTPRSDRSSRLRQFEAVVVVWTEGSVQSAGLSDIARETLPLNLLVPVRTEELDRTRLPLMFRKLNMFLPRDADGIARLVARLSTAASSLREIAANPPRAEKASARPEPVSRAASATLQQAAPPSPAPTSRSCEPQALPASPPRRAAPVVEPAAAARVRPLSDLPEVEAPSAEPTPRPAPPFERPAASRAAELDAALEQRRARRPAVTAADLARAVDDGLLVCHIPDAMWLGEPVTVEITLGRDVLAGLFPPDVVAGGHTAAAGADRQGIETLSVSLYGNADVFEIERQSERTQFVSPKEALAGRDPATFGRWAWLVTPHTAGTQDLVVRISALLRDRHGVPEPVALPDRRFEIVVDVPEGAGLVSGLLGWHRS